MFGTKRLLSGILLTLLTLAVLVAPGAALAKKDHDKAKGPITALDLTAGTLTVNDRKNGSVTVTVTSNTEIRKDQNKKATLADLAVGDSADVRYNIDSMVAERIKAKSPKVEGTITAIDLTAQSVTIQPFGGGAAVTVFATANTKIERNDARATLADFKVGDFGQARYNAQTFEASKIEAVGN